MGTQRLSTREMRGCRGSESLQWAPSSSTSESECWGWVGRMWLLLPGPHFYPLVGLRPSPPSCPGPARQEDQGDVGVILGGLSEGG